MRCDWCNRPAPSAVIEHDQLGRAVEVSCRACRKVLAEWLRECMAERDALVERP